MLDKVEMKKDEDLVVNKNKMETEDEILSDAEELVEHIVDSLVKEASTTKSDSTPISGLNCGKCEGEFTLREKLNEHVQRVHTDTKLEFTCESCQLKMPSAQELDLHIKVLHSDSCFECKKCEKKFTLENILIEHMQQIHKDSLIQNEANNVIKAIQDKFNKIRQWMKVLI